MKRYEHLDGTAVLLLLACCLFWGFQQVLVKMTLREVAPVFQASIRFVLATIVLVAWSKWRRKPLFASDGSFRAGLTAGLLFATEFVGIYVGLQHTTASRLTIFVYTSPLWVALLLPFFVRVERLRPSQWLGLGVAFGGVVLAFSESFKSGPGSLLGDALALGAGLCWGLTTVVIRSTVLARISAEKLLFYQVAVSSAVLPILSVALDEQWTASFSHFAIVSLAVQTIGGAFASFLVWMWLIGRYPATRLSAFTFLTPVFALLFGAFILDEPLTLALLIALAGVTAGIFLVNQPPRLRQPAPERTPTS